MKGWKIILLFVALSTLNISGALRVPEDYDSILSAVENSADGDTIEIAAGTYSGPNNTAIDLSSRNLTFIGSGSGSVIFDLASKSRAFYSSASANLRFVNLTFTGGYPNLGLGPNQQKDGGTFWFYKGTNIIMENCDIMSSTVPDEYNGGAILINNPAGNTSVATFINVNFRNCSTVGGDGGAIWANRASLTFIGGSFNNNTANGNGGAIYISNTNPTTTYSLIANLTSFTSNTADEGGAIWSRDPTLLSCDSSTFTSNSGSNGGGAFYLNGPSYLSITNSTCSSNIALGGFGGCGYLGANAGMVSRTCEMASNRASQGGGFFFSGGNIAMTTTSILLNSATRGGGFYASVSAAVQLNGCTVAQNSASERGGGFYLDSRVVMRINSTNIRQNSADQGGGFSCSDSKVTFTKSEISENKAPNDPVVYCASQPYLTFCNIMGDSELTGFCKIEEAVQGLSVAALAGIIVGVVIGVVFLTILCVFLCWHFDLRKRIREGKIWKSILGDEDIPDDDTPRDVEMKSESSERKVEEGSTSSD